MMYEALTNMIEKLDMTKPGEWVYQRGRTEIFRRHQQLDGRVLHEAL